jgi:hypothetical protein
MKYLVSALILLGLVSSAEAKSRHHAASGLHPMCNITMPCEIPATVAAVRETQRVARGKYVARQMGFGGVAPLKHRKEAMHHSTRLRQGLYNARPRPHTQQAGATRVASQIVAHPAGCPSRAFCGCGAAVRLLGAPVRALWLAANWFRFPRVAPAPDTAGVRRHHVIALIEHRHGSVWLVYDANSGGHATRIHEVDISRYTIVNPRT